MQEGRARGRRTAASALEDCVANAGTPGSIAADTKRKIAKARRQARRRDQPRSATASTPPSPFPASAPACTGAALRDCIDERVECRVCLTLNAIDNLAVDCDAFDDGQINLSCPRETFTLEVPPSRRRRPGSPGVTAVANPKLITQFGGTTST